MEGILITVEGSLAAEEGSSVVVKEDRATTVVDRAIMQDRAVKGVTEQADIEVGNCPIKEGSLLVEEGRHLVKADSHLVKEGSRLVKGDSPLAEVGNHLVEVGKLLVEVDRGPMEEGTHPVEEGVVVTLEDNLLPRNQPVVQPSQPQPWLCRPKIFTHRFRYRLELDGNVKLSCSLRFILQRNSSIKNRITRLKLGDREIALSNEIILRDFIILRSLMDNLTSNTSNSMTFYP